MALLGDDIRELQAGLHLLGYESVGTIDGIAGPNTNAQIAAFLSGSGADADPTNLDSVYDAIRSAVNADPSAQEKLRTLAANTDNLDTEQRRILQAGLNINNVRGANGQELEVDGINGRNTRSAVQAFNTSASTEAEAEAAPAPLDAEQTRLLQGGLIALGFDAGRIDGQYGGNTERALAAFMESQNIQGSAAANSDTLRAVQDAIKSGAAAQRMQDIAAGDASPNDIRALQAALTLNGQDAPLDGIIGNITRDALATALSGYVPAAPEIETPTIIENITPLPDSTVEVRDLPPLPVAEDNAPRNVHDVEAAQEALLASAAFEGLDTAYYLESVRENPGRFDTLLQTFQEKAAESPYYENLVAGMTTLKALESERQTLIEAATVPAAAPQTVAEIDAAQLALLNNPVVAALSEDDPDRYIDMMRNSPNLFAQLHESMIDKSGATDSVYTQLAEVMTGLRTLEDQRESLLNPTPVAETPAIVTPDMVPVALDPAPTVPLTYNDHPFGMTADTSGSLLIGSMAEYQDMPAHQAETQFAADRLTEILGTDQISLSDAAFALSVYKNGGDMDYAAIDRTMAEMGLERGHRFDLTNPADMNRVLTGLAAIESGGIANIQNGTAATIAQISGHDPAAATIAENLEATRQTIQVTAQHSM